VALLVLRARRAVGPAGDEVRAGRHELSVQIRVAKVHSGVDDGDHGTRAARARCPRPRRADLAQAPLARVQRVIDDPGAGAAAGVIGVRLRRADRCRGVAARALLRRLRDRRRGGEREGGDHGREAELGAHRALRDRGGFLDLSAQTKPRSTQYTPAAARTGA
jgi:hypothetical protein